MNIRAKITAIVLALALAPLACCAAQDAARPNASDNPTITYQKIFKSSYPEYVKIEINEAGTGTFDIRQLDESANPQPLTLAPEVTQKIFQLAASLHDFQGLELEARRRIANLGQKTFRYQKGGETHEVSFNFTMNDDANRLLNIFEGIAREESDISDLQRSMRYDPLGVNDALKQVESDYKQKLLPDPKQLLPTLDAIAKNDRIIDIARDKARTLAEQIRLER